LNARTFLLVLVIATTPATHDIARAESLEAEQKALDLITNTADKICNVVSTRGEAESSEVKGEIKAQLKGLAAKLADAGISGTGSIINEQYQSVLREDLPTALRDSAACKLKVFDTLQNKLLQTRPAHPTAAGQPQSGLESMCSAGCPLGLVSVNGGTSCLPQGVCATCYGYQTGNCVIGDYAHAYYGR
jgi:hypothetical protein